MESGRVARPTAQLGATGDEHKSIPSQAREGAGGSPFADLMGQLKGSMIAQHLERWNSAMGSLDGAKRQLSAEGRAMVDTQLLMQRINAETQLAAAVGEAFSSTLKRLQQLGGGS